jgi:hypothetical protein
MRSPTSIRRRSAAVEALESTRAAQTVFWKALGRLEKALGRELTSTIDFRETDIETLLDPEKLRHLL